MSFVLFLRHSYIWKSIAAVSTREGEMRIDAGGEIYHGFYYTCYSQKDYDTYLDIPPCVRLTEAI